MNTKNLILGLLFIGGVALSSCSSDYSDTEYDSVDKTKITKGPNSVDKTKVTKGPNSVDKTKVTKGTDAVDKTKITTGPEKN